MVRTVSEILANRYLIDNINDSHYTAPDDTDMMHCANCGEPIGYRDTYFKIENEGYCSRCEWYVRDLIDRFAAELVGFHLSDNALDAIIDDCEGEWGIL